MRTRFLIDEVLLIGVQSLDSLVGVIEEEPAWSRGPGQDVLQVQLTELATVITVLFRNHIHCGLVH